MTVHMYAADDFPLDSNLEEADLLRRELAFYIKRRRGKTTIVVHFDDYEPIVTREKTEEFLERVFGDLVRVNRLHPRLISQWIDLQVRGRRIGRQFRDYARSSIKRAVDDLDPHARKKALDIRKLPIPGSKKTHTEYNMYLPAPPKDEPPKEPAWKKGLFEPVAVWTDDAFFLPPSTWPKPSPWFPRPKTRRAHPGIPLTTERKRLKMSKEPNYNNAYFNPALGIQPTRHRHPHGPKPSDRPAYVKRWLRKRQKRRYFGHD